MSATHGDPVANLAIMEITKPKVARFSWDFFLGPHISSLNYYSWMLPSMFGILLSPHFWLLLFPYRSVVLCASCWAPAETLMGNRQTPRVQDSQCRKGNWGYPNPVLERPYPNSIPQSPGSPETFWSLHNPAQYHAEMLVLAPCIWEKMRPMQKAYPKHVAHLNMTPRQHSHIS